MVNLAICTVLCSMISIVMRLGRNRVSSTLNMMAVNYVTCILVAGALMGFGNPLSRTDGLGLALGMGLVNGFLYVASFLLLQYNIQKSGVVLASVYSRISLIVPLIGSIFLYHEIPTVCQWIGFAVCVVASVAMNEKDGSGGKFSLALPLLLLTDGAASITAKIFNDALREGENHLVLEVVNNLVHRNPDPFSHFVQLTPSGLLGPVRILY